MLVPITFHWTGSDAPKWCQVRLVALSVLILWQALGGRGVAEVVTFHLDAPDSVPISSAGYSAVGNSAEILLGFDPKPSAVLTLVRNTGNSFIEGRFSNMDHGQEVNLTRNGIVYRYVADYFGGTGNHLVLKRARMSVFPWGSYSTGGGTGGPYQEGVSNLLMGRSLIGIDGGEFHSVAVASDGAVIVWGGGSSNVFGVNLQQFGTISTPTLPVEVDRSGAMAGKRVVAVSAGENFNVALCDDGSLFSWGNGFYGMLGAGSTTSSTVPVAVDQSGVLAGRKVIAISAGFNHCIALCEDGALVGWGSNAAGQLGDFAGSSSNVPVLIPQTGALAGRSIRMIRAGKDFNLALDDTGNVVAWGANASGQMGNGTTSTISPPVLVDFGTNPGTPSDIADMAAGYTHAMVLAGDGTLWLWGGNGSGQLGNGTNASSSNPMPLPPGTALDGRDIIAISAGASHSVVVCDDDTLFGWGNNDYGQLNNGTSNVILSPVDITPSGLAGRALGQPACRKRSTSVLSGEADSDRLAGITLDGAVLTAPLDPRHPALSAVRLPGAASVTVTPFTFNPATVRIDGVTVSVGEASPPLHSGYEHSIEVSLPDGRTTEYLLFIPADGSIDVALGPDGTGIPEMEHVDVTSLNIEITLAHDPVPGESLTVIRNTGTEFIRGRFANLPRGAELTLSYGGRSHRYVANYFGGTGNDLVLEPANRTFLSWGDNRFGQTGTGGTSVHLVPVPVKTDGALAGKTVLSIASSSSSTLALCADGTLVAWGNNSWGQLGIGEAAAAYEPIVINGQGALQGREVAFIATGNVSSMAICTDRTVVMWGYNQYGMLGDGTTVTRKTPVLVSAQTPLADKTPVAGAIGGSHSLVLCSDGSMMTWGRSHLGSLGRQPTASLYTGWLMPGSVSSGEILAGKKVSTISCGLYHNVVHCSDGTPVVWGGNGDNELNLNTPSYGVPSVSSPIELARVGPLEGKSVRSAMACSRNTLLLCSDSSLVTLGAGQSGQLGDGTTVTQSAAPVAVDASGVLAGRTIIGAVAGDSCCFAIDSDGLLCSWGLNYSGQLGDGTKENRSRPVRVENSGFLYGGKVLSMTSGGAFGHSHALVWMPEDGFVGWIADQSVTTNRTEAGDPDGDGIPNLLEFALGGDPASASSPGKPLFSRDAAMLSFSFQRFIIGGDQPAPFVQWSTDFLDWETIRIDGAPDDRVILGEVGESGMQQVMIRIPAPSGDRCFLRLAADSE